MIGVLLPLSASVTMIYAAPDGVSCASDRLLKNLKFLAAGPRRGPAAESFREYDLL